MRLMLVALLVMGLSWAECTNITSAELINSSMNLSAGSCINITDLNAVISSTPVADNATINLTAYEEYHDSLTNRSYFCRYNQLNVNTTLGYGESYSQPANNITVKCRTFEPMNLRLNLIAGENYSNSTYNVSIYTFPKLYNISKRLNYTENYTNTEINVTILPPEKKNLIRTLDFGQTHTDEDVNLTYIAPGYPTFNETKTLKCNEHVTYPLPNINIFAPACIGVAKTLSYGEQYANPDYGITVTAPSKLGVSKYLTDGEEYKNEAADIRVTCDVGISQYEAFCMNMTDENVTRLWKLIDLTNSSCQNLVYQCVDNLTQYCKVEEKFLGIRGFQQCFNRNIEEINAKCKQDQDKLTICENERSQLMAGPKSIAEAQDGVIDGAISLASIAVLVGAAVFLLVRWLTNKKTERGLDREGENE